MLDQTKRAAFSGLRIEEFKKLVIPSDVMREGILFIWAEKELIQEIILHFETQGFEYVENMVYVMLDPSMKEGKFNILVTTVTNLIRQFC